MSVEAVFSIQEILSVGYFCAKFFFHPQFIHKNLMNTQVNVSMTKYLHKDYLPDLTIQNGKTKKSINAI